VALTNETRISCGLRRPQSRQSLPFQAAAAGRQLHALVRPRAPMRRSHRIPRPIDKATAPDSIPMITVIWFHATTNKPAAKARVRAKVVRARDCQRRPRKVVSPLSNAKNPKAIWVQAWNRWPGVWDGVRTFEPPRRPVHAKNRRSTRARTRRTRCAGLGVNVGARGLTDWG
jgi:hypothetical protein